MKKQQPDADGVLDALGDPTRRRIVEMLGERPHSVSGLAMPLGVTLTAVGQHLQVLEECGLVKTEKIGRTRTCQLDSAGLHLLEKWIHARRSAWEHRLDRLGELLSDE